MPNRYQWFNITDAKFKNTDRRLVNITINDLQQVLGQYLFNFPNMQDLDFVIGQILNIKERTISAYPELTPNKWGEGKGETFIEKINAALDNIENMNLIDALEKWLGKKHKIPGPKGQTSFIDNLYLDKDDKIWKVNEIMDANNHDEFSQALIYGKSDKRKLQLGFRDAILQKEDFDDLIKNAEIKVTEEKGGLGEKSDYKFLKFNINFGFDINTTIHTKRLKEIFGRQKIIFVNDTKTIKGVEKPDPKFKPPKVTRGDLKTVEDNPLVEGQSAERATASGRFIGGGGTLRESDINPVKHFKTKEIDESPEFQTHEIKYDKDGNKIVPEGYLEEHEGRIMGLEEWQEKTQEMEEQWKAQRRLEVDASDILDDGSPENIKKWLLELWDSPNEQFWHYMLNSGMPLNLTKIGNYTIKVNIKRDLKGRTADEITLSWAFSQKKSLAEELLMNPAGSKGLYAQKFNLGSGQPETTKIIGPTGDADKEQLAALGFNKDRDFIANFVTSRVNTLERAITNSDANEGGEE